MARAGGVVLAAGLIAALLYPLYAVRSDIEEQVELTRETRALIAEQLAVTEELADAMIPLAEEAQPVVSQLREDLPALRQLVDDATPLVAQLREDLPAIRQLVDDATPLVAELRAALPDVVALVEETREQGLPALFRLVTLAEELREEAREIRERMPPDPTGGADEALDDPLER